ncbi:hypothetical protein GSQ51_18190 [Clostridioides difficile]|nr:hypothetical protein [Clostridioides difficile]NJK16019.1 hypothetical protein [Clostridioides difficile]
MNVKLLKSEIILKEKNVSDLASDIGISKSAMYKKICGKTEFTYYEISQITKCLQLNKKKAIDIFFNH